jgi:Uma2 family endonuclease
MSAREVYPTQIARLFPPQGQWTEEDYFALPDAMQIVELSDGEIIMPPPPVPLHQQIIMKLGFALNGFAREADLGSVYLAPVAVRLWKGKIREPDILFIRKEHRERIQETLIEGAPDWVAEVISPGTRKTDEVQKLSEYARAGIPEYWLLDPKKNTIRVYHLEENAYALIQTYHPGQVARSVVISAFEVSVDEVLSQ